MEKIDVGDKKVLSDIDQFVVKSQESTFDEKNVYVRSYSKSHRYDFRYKHDPLLPESGANPTENKKKKKDGYYYHVTSFANLSGICKFGLNPKSGGKIGGSSFQNSEKEMNEKSSKDSEGKVFVATVTKLTQRYLSFRLRQEDLLEKHRELIVDTIVANTTFKKKAVDDAVSRLISGEMPVVLRFKNYWEPKFWVNDPIDKEAFALVGKEVTPEQIECLTIEGWVPVSKLAEMASFYKRNELEIALRDGVLKFFGTYNADLEKMSAYEAYATLQEHLVDALQKSGFLKK